MALRSDNEGALHTPGSSGFRTGFVAVVGRPNVGKSTLVNALVGQKVSITADKAQTTRHRIHGILTTTDAQYVFIDTPGYQTRFGGALNRSMNRAVMSALADVDCIVFVVEALRFAGEDRRVLQLLPPEVPVILVIAKADLAKPRDALLPFIGKLAVERAFAAVVPVSARRGEQLDALLAEVRKHLPEGAPMFAPDDYTDRSLRFLSAETIREKVFRLVGDELPYRSTVQIDKFEEGEQLQRIYATVLVDSDNHKAILIGANGERIKRIASEARVDLERQFGTRVYLELWVKVRSGWADSDASVRAAGHE